MQGIWASSRRTSLCATITLQVRKDFLTRRSQCKGSLSTTLHRILHINHAAEGDARRPKSHKSPTLTSPIPAESHARTAKCLTSPQLLRVEHADPRKGWHFRGVGSVPPCRLKRICLISHASFRAQVFSCKCARASFLVRVCSCKHAPTGVFAPIFSGQPVAYAVQTTCVSRASFWFLQGGQSLHAQTSVAP